LPPAVVAELARRAEDALNAAKRAAARSETYGVKPKLDFRVGRTPTFTRLSFRWNVSFEANFSRSDDGVAIIFNRSDDPDLSRINVDLPPLLRTIGKRDSEEGLTITLAVDPRATVRAFRADDAYVVDRHRTRCRWRRATRCRNWTPELLRQPDLDEMVEAPGTEKPLAVATDADAPAMAAPAKPAGGPSAAMAPTTSMAPGPQPMAPAAPTAENPPTGAASSPLPPALVPAPAADASPAQTPSPPPPAPAEAPAAADDDRPLVPRVVQSGATDQIVLPFSVPVASAVFRRGNDLWIVVDSAAPLDMEPVRAGLRSRVNAIASVPLDGGQAFRLTLKAAQLVSVSQNGNDWLVALGDTVVGTTKRVDLARGLRPDGKVILTADFRDAGKVHACTSGGGRRPDRGDRQGPARGLLVPQDFVGSARCRRRMASRSPRADDIEAGYRRAGGDRRKTGGAVAAYG
jgi:hypothetical protein